MRLAILFVSLSLACSAPVPLVSPVATSINTDDGLLVLVPTVSANKADGQPSKRDVEYEVIAIPGEVLRREIRQITGLYNAPSPTPFGGSAALGQPGYVAPAPAPAFGGDAVLSTAGNILESTGNNLNSIGDATVQNAGNAIQFISEVSQGAGATLAESAGSGLQYAGQLSGALLRALLQVPAIKVRVVQRLLQSPQPLITVVSNFIANSADGAADVFETGTGLLNEAIGIVVRMVQDTLALKGRAIAAIGEAGLGVGDNAIQSGGALIGAVIESGQNAGVVIGDGVGEIVNLGSSAGFPTFPALPAFHLPQPPAPVLPQLTFPNLGALFPPKPAAAPRQPAPTGGAFALPTFEQIGQEIENIVGPLFNKPAPAPVGGAASLGQPGGVALPRQPGGVALPQGGYLPPGK